MSKNNIKMSIKEQFLFYKKRFNYGDLFICEIILGNYSDEDFKNKTLLEKVYNELITNCNDYGAIQILEDKKKYFC